MVRIMRANNKTLVGWDIRQKKLGALRPVMRRRLYAQGIEINQAATLAVRGRFDYA